MTRELLGAVTIGVSGTAVLLALGFWQVQRLEWKRGVIAEIESRITSAPVSLPPDPEPTTDRFLPVEATGRIGSPAFRVMTTDGGGPAFRIVSPFETGGRVVLLDRGVLAADEDVPAPPDAEVTVLGNLHWPDEADGFTPAPDLSEGLWYARDVGAMAAAMGVEPLLIVAREIPGDPVSARPIDTAVIPNDHLQYAITWFSLAAIWSGMTALLVWRIRRRIG